MRTIAVHVTMTSMNVTCECFEVESSCDVTIVSVGSRNTFVVAAASVLTGNVVVGGVVVDVVAEAFAVVVV